MKDDHAALTHEPGDALYHRRRVRIEHEDVAANYGVERLGEFQRVQIALAE
jgi:hypothetical protein